MANIKVSEMTEATEFDDLDYAMIVQANQNKKIVKNNLFKDLTDSIDEVDTNLTNAIEEIKVDYIVEQGTDGIWTYRKWNSGIAECWGTQVVDTAFNSTAAGISHSGTKTAPNYPTDLFIAAPKLTGTAWGGTSNGTHCYLSFTAGGSYTKPSNYYLFRNASPTTTSYTIGVTFEAKGRWKE